jgi:hypothetical protein
MTPSEYIAWTIATVFSVYSVLQWILQAQAENEWLRRLRRLEERIAKLEPLPQVDMERLLK